MLYLLGFCILMTLGAFVAIVVIRRGKPNPLPDKPADDDYNATTRYRQLEVEFENRNKTFSTSYRRTRWIAFGLLGLTIILTALMSFTSVPTRNIGIVTTFGRPNDATLENGLHLKAPWEDVVMFDASVQTDKFTGNEDKDELKTTHTCTTVRIGNQSTACVDNSVRWQIVKEQGDELFQDYKEFESVRDSLVTRQLITALNEAFAAYDPLNNLDENGRPKVDTLSTIANRVKTSLTNKIGTQVIIHDVNIPLINFDATTQDKINAFQAEVANTRIAKQKQATADAEAIANGKLAASVSKDPNVLVSKCLDTFNQMVKQEQPVPAAFSCWPGSNSAVVIPQSK